MTRPVNTVLIEAIVIGVMNVSIIYGIKRLNTNIENYLLYLIAGASFISFLNTLVVISGGAHKLTSCNDVSDNLVCLSHH
jgi:hypothetical protein